MRLIDADEFVKTLQRTSADVCADFGDGFANFGYSRSLIRLLLSESPTIDAVPVVRCRECIAYTPVDDNTGKCVFLIGEHQYVVPDGYCYLGERKEGAN